MLRFFFVHILRYSINFSIPLNFKENKNAFIISQTETLFRFVGYTQVKMKLKTITKLVPIQK